MNTVTKLHLNPGLPISLMVLILLCASTGVRAQQLTHGIVKGETAQGYQFMSGGVVVENATQ